MAHFEQLQMHSIASSRFGNDASEEGWRFVGFKCKFRENLSKTLIKPILFWIFGLDGILMMSGALALFGTNFCFRTFIGDAVNGSQGFLVVNPRAIAAFVVPC